MVEVVALGGLGQFGMNMMAFTANGSRLLIDAGVAFPDGELPGVDLVVPALDYLDTGPRPCALVLTHGHEDHIGAVPYVLPFIDGPVIGTALTTAMALAKAAEHNVEPAVPAVVLATGSRVRAGAFDIEFIAVNHSIPDSVAVAVHSPEGVLVHTGDFKCDQTPPDSTQFDLRRFSELGENGVLALFSDSTNADRPGFTPSERSVIEPLRARFAAALGKIVVSTFSTSIHRIQILADLSAEFDRRLVFLGPSMTRNVEIAGRVGCLRIPSGLQIAESAIGLYAPEEITCIATGSQGQPTAALPRMARGDHRHLVLESDDLVVLSSRVIPGNERFVNRMANELSRRDVELVAGEASGVHVSGHGSQQELRLLLSLLRPRYLIPIHGEYLQMRRHATLAREFKSEVLLAENGDRLTFHGGSASIAGTAPVGRVYLDGARTGRVTDETVRDRKCLAREGVLVAIVTIHGARGGLVRKPDLAFRGLPLDGSTSRLLDRCAVHLEARLQELASQVSDTGFVREFIVTELHALLHAESSR